MQQVTAKQYRQAFENVEPGSQLDLVLHKWKGFSHTVKLNGAWKLEGFITWFQQNYEILRAIEPSLEPTMPPQCLDPESIARLFRIPVEELAPWLSVEQTRDEGFTDEDRTQLCIIKKLVEGHIASGRTEELVEAVTLGHRELLEQFTNVTNKVEDVQGELGQHKTVKEWYSPKEVAELLGKVPFTVQEWCRLGRVNARKRPTGRGDAKEWEISREEVDRITNHGLLPRSTKY
ncbi:MerR family transcriptional regulator [Gimesia algae]|uniref:Helix-turn-helix domain protein n=1 Tax=Gimesia algae TaxID=2527971 RepID=A0A517VFD5_9PLAN|nr:hypothetical protein [Gimesia algae]QDT91723.1 hypothetical protein Pan161_33860 [Gimesia algae]